MRTLPLALVAALLTTPALAQTPLSLPVAQRLDGVTAEEAARLIRTLQEAQADLRADRPAYFELLSGAPAAYEQTRLAPREVFLETDFSAPFSVIRRDGHPRRFDLTYLPEGPGRRLWRVSVWLEVSGDLQRVEMVNMPPAPF